MYAVPPPRKPQQRSLEQRVWGGVLAFAGAAAGLAGIVYLIGAATLWLGLRDRGYSPDAGIEHQSKSQLIGLGLRGLLLVAGLTLLLALVVFAFNLRPVIEGLVEGVRFRYSALAALVPVLAASLVNWRWVALAIPVTGLVVAFAAEARLTAYRRQWSWLLLLVAAVLAALAWQYGGVVEVTAVRVLPRSGQPLRSLRVFESKPCTGPDGKPATSSYALVNGERIWLSGENDCHLKGVQTRKQVRMTLRRCSVPYFGQTGGYVYLGAISRVWEDAAGLCHWDAGGIVELRRDAVRLRYLHGRVRLAQPEERSRPYKATWKAAKAFFKKLD